MPKPIDMEDATLDGINSMHSEKTCYQCRFYRSNNETCKAYPKRIPHKFLIASEVHDKPEPGDHGIQFEPIEESKAKSPVRKSIEVLRDELQALFPEQKVVIK